MKKYMEFKKTNLNPSGRRTGDCVVRAIMKSLGKNWIDVYLDLSQIGAEEYSMPNNERVYGRYLKENGFEKQKMKMVYSHQTIGCDGIKDHNKRLTVEEFANQNPLGTYLLHIQGHLTVLIDGTLFDTFDCRYSKVGIYYTN